jgi:hypothetical protein
MHLSAVSRIARESALLAAAAVSRAGGERFLNGNVSVA